MSTQATTTGCCGLRSDSTRSLLERQSELIGTHCALQDAGLPYVLVGGWVVSAFQTRFATDVGMVLPETSLDEYDALFNTLSCTKEPDNDVANIYAGRIVRYEKPVDENAVESTPYYP